MLEVKEHKLRGRTIRKVIGEGGVDEVLKKNSMHEKLSEKIHAQQVVLKNSSCTQKKDLCSSKIPPPPHNLTNGPSLTCH